MTDDHQTSPNELDPAIGAAPPRRLRFQFSLATLFWLTTVVACLIALCVMYGDLRDAREEVRKYRDEMGYLDIANRGEIYARGLRTLADCRWSWRIYLPEKRRFSMCTAARGISAEGIPPRSPWNEEMAPGEHLIEASAEGNPEGQWYFDVVVDRSEFKHSKFPVTQPNRNCAVEAVSKDQRSADPESPMVLLRLRINGPHFDDPQPCDGVMIWIEEDK